MGSNGLVRAILAVGLAASTAIGGLALTAAPAAAGQEPVVYLTFDDGPGVDTARFLDLLARYDVQATFFATGRSAAARPDLVRRIVADGHAIANHSWSHPRLTDLSSAAIVDQLVATSDVIEAASGVRPTCYRPPYGATDARVHAAAVGAGLPNADWTTGSSGSHWGLWDIDTNDWRLSQPGSGWSEAAMRRELDKVGDGDTVLMHDGSSPRPRGLAVLEQWLAGNHDRFEFRALPGCGGQLVEPALDPAQPQRWHRFQIARLYRAYFDRAPDAAGWEYWSRVYSQGHPLTAISDLFATSSELGLRGEMTDDELVVFVYRHVLDRAPDEGGRRYWLGELERGLTRGELVVWFSESDEYVARTVEVMAGDCYDGTVAGSYRCWAGTLPSYDW